MIVSALAACAQFGSSLDEMAFSGDRSGEAVVETDGVVVGVVVKETCAIDGSWDAGGENAAAAEHRTG